VVAVTVPGVPVVVTVTVPGVPGVPVTGVPGVSVVVTVTEPIGVLLGGTTVIVMSRDGEGETCA
jgi:hypothetical protein